MKGINLKNEFDKLKTSEDQFVWLVNASLGSNILKVTLDNDDAWLTFGKDDDGEYVTSSLMEHLGNSYGVILLLTAMGLDVELC